MQVTTTGSISGTMNYQVFPLGVGADQVQVSVDFDGAGTFGGGWCRIRSVKITGFCRRLETADGIDIIFDWGVRSGVIQAGRNLLWWGGDCTVIALRPNWLQQLQSQQCDHNIPAGFGQPNDKQKS